MLVKLRNTYPKKWRCDCRETFTTRQQLREHECKCPLCEEVDFYCVCSEDDKYDAFDALIRTGAMSVFELDGRD